jgi:hypothetical protein
VRHRAWAVSSSHKACSTPRHVAIATVHKAQKQG